MAQQSKLKTKKDKDNDAEKFKDSNNLKILINKSNGEEIKFVIFCYVEILSRKYQEIYILVNQQYRETLIILEVNI